MPSFALIAAGPAGISPSLKVLIIVFLVILVLIGLLLIVLWFRSRKPAVSGTTALKPGSLRKIYKRFLQPLPWRARSVLLTYPWVVVLGDSGAGKTQIIGTHVDWQGQQSQFFPSYTADPLLQFYLGGRVLVQELASPLLNDSSAAAKIALRKLWQPLCRRMPPTILIVLSYRALRRSTPEQIQRHAQLLRGKINILSELRGEPVRTRICLSFMDRQPGFAEFARLLNLHQIPISMPLRSESGELIDLRSGLTSYEKYLPLALTSLSAGEFRVLVEFLINSPSVLSGLSESLRILGEDIAFSHAPAFDRLYFAAEGVPDKMPSPFFVRALQPFLSLSKRGIRWEFWRSLFDLTHLRIHLVGFAVIAGLAALLYGSIYHSHLRRVEATTAAVEHLEDAVFRAEKSLNAPAASQTVRNSAEEAGAQLLRLRRFEEGRRIIGRLHKDEKRDAHTHFLTAVRRAYLLPALTDSRAPKDRHRFIRTLGVLYAGRYNTLGHEIRRAPDEWAAAVPIPAEILLKYVDLADPPFAVRVPVPAPLPADELLQNPAADLAPWFSYLTILDAAFVGPTLTRVQLQRLQQVTRRFAEALGQAQKNRIGEHILRVLSEESAVDLNALFGSALPALMPPAWLTENAERLQAFFQMILHGNLEPPRAEQVQLSELMSLLTPPPSPANKKDTVYTFELSGRTFRFSSARWQELLASSKRRDLLAGIGKPSREKSEKSAEKSSPKPARHHRHRSRKSDAGDSTRASAGKSKASSKFHYLGEVTGTDSISPLYTRAGFEKEMKPNLLDAEKRLEAAPLSPEQKQQVASILLGQAKRYAKNYREAQFSYLLGYKPRGDSLMSIVGMLTELLANSSPLLERLRVIADNAALGPLTGAYFAPINEELPALAPLARLAAQKDGVYPEYEKYKVIIAKLIKDVSSSVPDEPAVGFTPVGAAGAGDAKAADAKAAAKPGAVKLDTPTGAARVTAAVLFDQETSALRQIEAFLDAAGIVGDLRRPFLAPLLRVYKLGAQDLEKAVASKWAEQAAQHVAPLQKRFPFQRSAKAEATASDLAAFRPPDGAFWTFVQRQVAPLCSANQRLDGSLMPLEGPLGALKLPEDLLTSIGKLRRLARALWNGDGTEKPIALSVKALPLPAVSTASAASAPLVTQTFLSCSNVAVHGYNQMPESKAFPLPWSRQENSSVGVELGSADSKARRYQSLDVNGSAWSFYRLLDKAEWSEDNVATWQIPGNGQGTTPRPVRFGFDSDPWAIFQLGQASADKSQP